MPMKDDWALSDGSRCARVLLPNCGQLFRIFFLQTCEHVTEHKVHLWRDERRQEGEGGVRSGERSNGEIDLPGLRCNDS
jgi:hypothetical protein